MDKKIETPPETTLPNGGAAVASEKIGPVPGWDPVVRSRRGSPCQPVPHECTTAWADATFAALCGVTILLSAFLVFQVQPLMGKLILPWFGGSPAVWSTCLVFFQLALLTGYAYAFGLSRLIPVKWQPAVHLGLGLAALCVLPIMPASSCKPADAANPTGRILWLLLTHVGLPYFALSATAPLLQSWYAVVRPGGMPYRFYALSNVGSLLALLSFPFWVEPHWPTNQIGWAWSFGFCAFVALCAALAALQLKSLRVANRPVSSSARPLVDSIVAEVSDQSSSTNHWLLWLLLAAWGSFSLLAMTNQICQEITVVPMLWIIPLSVYLVTFIICFDRPGWFSRRWWGLTTTAVLVFAAMFHGDQLRWVDHLLSFADISISFDDFSEELFVQAGIFTAVLFVICMVCHGELVRRKPPPHRLTSFYLALATGGALGGLVVTIVCPIIFSTYAETELAMAGGLLLAVWLIVQDTRRHGRTTRALVGCAGCVILLTGLNFIFAPTWLRGDEDTIARMRNFYGVMRVQLDVLVDGQRGQSLYHGMTLHGFQYLSPKLRRTPTTYYDQGSGVGVTLARRSAEKTLRVGVVGLGVGTIAAYGREGDYYHFYEINENVIRLAQETFHFLKDSPARKEFTLGDARISLEHQPPQEFDILVLDAFSGDAVPVHLLTVEAFELYRRHLRPDGIIAVHVSNRYLNLFPVVATAAKRHAMHMVYVNTTRDETAADAASDWLLLTRNEDFVHDLWIQDVSSLCDDLSYPPVLWTDQYSSLLKVLDY